jgi:hypothetical protein
LAAQENKELRLCDKCFFMLPEGAQSCPDCGAPVEQDASGTDSSDALIYPELARANLLRMRGEYKQAEDVCLRILRQYPNNATANTLLGDICAERGDLEHAAEWYELALDIVPDSAADQQKLEQVRERLRQRQAAETAQQLGLDSRKSPVGLYIVGMILFLALVGSAAFYLGRQNAAKPSLADRNNVVNVPVWVGETAGREKSPGDVSATPSGLEGGDSLLMGGIAGKVQVKSTLLTAWQDPRTQHVYLTFSMAEGENERMVAAAFAKASFDYASGVSKVTMRCLQNGQETYVADSTRELYTAMLDRERQSGQQLDAPSMANAILANEWRRDNLPAPSSDTPVSSDGSVGGTSSPSGDTGGTSPADPGDGSQSGPGSNMSGSGESGATGP